MTIRPARTTDLDAVTDLEREVFAVDAWSAAAVEEELIGERRQALVAVEGGRVVGYAVVLRSDDLADLQRIAVAPAHRRTGVASVLLQAAREAARSCGANRMLLEVSADNTGALAFYAARGFTQIDRRARYYRDGSDALVLQTSLDVPAQEGGAS